MFSKTPSRTRRIMIKHPEALVRAGEIPTNFDGDTRVA
jgi:hypothetical protein